MSIYSYPGKIDFLKKGKKVITISGLYCLVTMFHFVYSANAEIIHSFDLKLKTNIPNVFCSGAI